MPWFATVSSTGKKRVAAVFPQGKPYFLSIYMYFIFYFFLTQVNSDNLNAPKDMRKC